MGSADVLHEVVHECVGGVCSYFLFHHSLPPAEALYKVTSLLKLGYHVLYVRKQSAFGFAFFGFVTKGCSQAFLKIGVCAFMCVWGGRGYVWRSEGIRVLVPTFHLDIDIISFVVVYAKRAGPHAPGGSPVSPSHLLAGVLRLQTGALMPALHGSWGTRLQPFLTH